MSPTAEASHSIRPPMYSECGSIAPNWVDASASSRRYQISPPKDPGIFYSPQMRIQANTHGCRKDGTLAIQ